MRIIMFDIDTLRPDHLGCYGYARDTSPRSTVSLPTVCGLTTTIAPTPPACPAGPP